jgi:hypothetical protein
MAFVWVREVFDTSGKFAISTNDVVRTLQVFTDDPVNDDVTACRDWLKSEGIAYVGLVHPKIPFCWCRNVDPRSDNRRHKGLYNVTLNYSDAPISQRDRDKIEIRNPLDRPAIVRGRPIREQVPRLTDAKGKTCQNPVGDPYDPPLMKPRTRLSIVWQKNFAEIPEWYWRLNDRTNSKPFYIGHKLKYMYRPHTLFLSVGDFSEEKNENGISYITIDGVIEVMESVRIVGLHEKMLEGDEWYEKNDFREQWTPIPQYLIDRPASEAPTNDPRGFNQSPPAPVRRFGGWDQEILNRGWRHFKMDKGVKKKVPFRDDLSQPYATPQLLTPDGDKATDPSYTRYLEFEEDFAPLREFLS